MKCTRGRHSPTDVLLAKTWATINVRLRHSEFRERCVAPFWIWAGNSVGSGIENEGNVLKEIKKNDEKFIHKVYECNDIHSKCKWWGGGGREMKTVAESHFRKALGSYCTRIIKKKLCTKKWLKEEAKVKYSRMFDVPLSLRSCSVMCI